MGSRWIVQYLGIRLSSNSARPISLSFLCHDRHTRQTEPGSLRYSRNGRLWARSRGCVSIYHAVGWRGAAWRSLDTRHDCTTQGPSEPYEARTEELAQETLRSSGSRPPRRGYLLRPPPVHDTHKSSLRTRQPARHSHGLSPRHFLSRSRPESDTHDPRNPSHPASPEPLTFTTCPVL